MEAGGSSKEISIGNAGAGGYAGNLTSAGNGQTVIGQRTDRYGVGAVSSVISKGWDDFINYDHPDSPPPYQRIPLTEKGNLGKGGIVDYDGAGAGGSGYYGGSSAHREYSGGGGGISFVYSGTGSYSEGQYYPFPSIVASQFSEKITEDLRIKFNTSGLWTSISSIKNDRIAISGNSLMENPLRTGSTMTGNEGNGYVIIKKVS
ncbi:MAG: glycine-rich protein [Clostridia bacterium]|nr:glycine-rich protein [Clostridia bacterium]MDD4375656.1 glycine-rich protein [Clostridia bacterium]